MAKIYKLMLSELFISLNDLLGDNCQGTDLEWRANEILDLFLAPNPSEHVYLKKYPTLPSVSIDSSSFNDLKYTLKYKN